MIYQPSSLPVNRLFTLVFFSFVQVLLAGNCRAGNALAFEYQTAFSGCQQAVCELRLRQAESELRPFQQKFPDNVALDYLEFYIRFYQIMIHQDKTMLPAFESARDNLFVRISQLPSSTPYKLHTRGSVELLSAVVSGTFEEYLPAATGFRSAYLTISENRKLFPSFLTNKKEFGALKALIGTFPDKYRWLVSVVGLEGDFDGGLRLLDEYNEASSNEPLVERQLGEVFYALIQLNFGKEKKKAWTFYESRSADYSTNLMKCYIRSYVAGKCGQNARALQALKARPVSTPYEQIQYLNFMMGNCLLNSLDLSASIWFKKYIAFSTSKSSARDAYRKLSWIALIEGDKEKFLVYKGLMEKYQKSVGSEDKLINSDLKTGVYPDIRLIKARLLFDGGYYQQAREIIGDIRKESLKGDYQALEFEYRLARIEQESGDINNAIKSFKNCLAYQGKVVSYYLPNSCLQLGEIYRKLSYNDLAEYYYNKVFGFSNYDYEDSIRQEAKAGIIQLK